MTTLDIDGHGSNGVTDTYGDGYTRTDGTDECGDGNGSGQIYLYGSGGQTNSKGDGYGFGIGNNIHGDGRGEGYDDFTDA